MTFYKEVSMSRVWITGDTHGELEIYDRFTEKYFPQLTSLDMDEREDNYVIILGDAGILFGDTNDDILAFLEDMPFITLWIDGNHDDHALIEDLEHIKMFGNTVGKVSDSVFHLMRGKHYHIHDLDIFTFGGAKSIDKHLRLENVDWWEAEVPSHEEYEEGLETLDLLLADTELNKLYVLSHSCPTDIKSHLVTYDLGIIDPTEYYLTEFYNRILDRDIEYHHFFGHFHEDEEIDDVFTAVYEEFIELL